MSLSGIDRARPSLSSRIQFPYSQRDDFRTSPLGVELDPIATHRGIYAIGEKRILRANVMFVSVTFTFSGGGTLSPLGDCLPCRSWA
jgi:hypothetical protein